MKEAVVIAGCTHKEGFVDEYASQLERSGIDFHLETLEPMPNGPNSMTILRRIRFVRDMAELYFDYQTIYATDAWDVLFLGTKEALIVNAPDTVTIAAERNCYPEGDLALRIHSLSPWRYANAGLIAGSPSSLLRWCDEIEGMPELDILDQAWFNRRRAEGSPLITLDITTRLFYVASAWLEDGALQAKNGRIWNSVYDTYPSFFHFSGKCPTDHILNLLERA